MDEEEPSHCQLGRGELYPQPVGAARMLGHAEQRCQIGIEVTLGHPLVAPVEHRERHHGQAQQLVLDRAFKISVRYRGVVLLCLALGELLEQPSVQLGPAEFCRPALQGVVVGVIEGKHEQQ